jgi:Cyclic-phosphate processing Receiver domain
VGKDARGRDQASDNWSGRGNLLGHDLGLLDREPEATGYDVVVWIEEQVATAGFVPPEVITVHSSNSSAAPKMERGIGSIRRLAEQRAEPGWGAGEVALEPHLFFQG